MLSTKTRKLDFKEPSWQWTAIALRFLRSMAANIQCKMFGHCRFAHAWSSLEVSASSLPSAARSQPEWIDPMREPRWMFLWLTARAQLKRYAWRHEDECLRSTVRCPFADADASAFLRPTWFANTLFADTLGTGCDRPSTHVPLKDECRKPTSCGCLGPFGAQVKGARALP